MPAISQILVLIVAVLISVSFAAGQNTTSHVDLLTIYSQNERFYLKSIPYDNEFPTLRGKTWVYELGNLTPLYVIDRGFDAVEKDSNNLILSNNGQVIFYANPYDADDDKEDLKSVTIYKNGQLLKSFTETEITACDKKTERCSLLYSNYDEVIDRDKSNWGTNTYEKAFKSGISEREKFLSDFPIFAFDDTVYLTDSKQQVHSFDLIEGRYLGNASFANVFEQIKNKGRFNRVKLTGYTAPVFLDFPKLKDGRDPYLTLAKYIGMKSASIFGTKDEPYKLYSFKLNSNILRDGSLEIESIEFLDDLPKEKITEFFRVNKFDSSSVPRAFDKWNIGDEYFYFRKQDDRVARQEKREELREAREEYERRLTLDSIDNVYIPKDLGECFVELDRLLGDVDKKEMQSLPKRDDMIAYHLGLGMWMRNNWGLHGGSRLQKYFRDRHITNPEEMSTIVLYHYHDWLTGQKETWKIWEKNPAHM